mmetsp:Transcript_16148/g.31592  ORF Transcript_16148/g.31592 Transcript_16148/m.31592 type:complete len:111 (+) Transcript_16148:316-648(+)
MGDLAKRPVSKTDGIKKPMAHKNFRAWYNTHLDDTDFSGCFISTWAMGLRRYIERLRPHGPMGSKALLHGSGASMAVVAAKRDIRIFRRFQILSLHRGAFMIQTSSQAFV